MESYSSNMFENHAIEMEFNVDEVSLDSMESKDSEGNVDSDDEFNVLEHIEIYHFKDCHSNILGRLEWQILPFY